MRIFYFFYCTNYDINYWIVVIYFRNFYYTNIFSWFFTFNFKFRNNIIVNSFDNRNCSTFSIFRFFRISDTINENNNILYITFRRKNSNLYFINKNSTKYNKNKKIIEIYIFVNNEFKIARTIFRSNLLRDSRNIAIETFIRNENKTNSKFYIV